MKFIGLVGTNSKRSTNRQLLQYILKSLKKSMRLMVLLLEHLSMTTQFLPFS